MWEFSKNNPSSCTTELAFSIDGEEYSNCLKFLVASWHQNASVRTTLKVTSDFINNSTLPALLECSVIKNNLEKWKAENSFSDIDIDDVVANRIVGRSSASNWKHYFGSDSVGFGVSGSSDALGSNAKCHVCYKHPVFFGKTIDSLYIYGIFVLLDRAISSKKKKLQSISTSCVILIAVLLIWLQAYLLGSGDPFSILVPDKELYKVTSRCAAEYRGKQISFPAYYLIVSHICPRFIFELFIKLYFF